MTGLSGEFRLVIGLDGAGSTSRETRAARKPYIEEGTRGWSHHDLYIHGYAATQKLCPGHVFSHLGEIAVTRFCRLSFAGFVVGSVALLPGCHTRLFPEDTNVTFTEQCSQSDFAEIDPGRAITATVHASRKGTCAKVKT